jgi:aldehyde oxidoreductase
MDIKLEVNGSLRTIHDVGDKSLLRVLREDLRLTGTKQGCDDQGTCGACMVLIDGEPKQSCLLKAVDVQGGKVTTIEGIADPETGKLHPIQQAFIYTGAVQCGFCTSGMILASKALLDKNPQPSVEDIKEALKHNLCRCGDYSDIINAVQIAAKALADGSEVPALPARERSVIGVSVAKPDAVGKVTGQTLYSADLFKENMLVGKTLWSIHPHAEILSLDTKDAEAMPGVEAVLTAKDVPGLNRFGPFTVDQPVLAEDRVRFIGDALALVFAETPEIAEAALNKIHVEYKPLSGVFSPEDALKPGAPQIHEDGNVLTHLEVATGDIESAMSSADAVVQGEYFTPFVDHAFLEPEAGIAVANEDGGITIWTGVQNPFEIRKQVAAAIALPEEKVRMVNMAVGGAFGGKCDVSLQIFLALGALKTGRPVKMIFKRAEGLRFHPKRHAFKMKYRIGATNDGKLVGIEADVVGDTGAYASWGQIVLQSVACFTCGPYVVPNTSISLKAVYTNNPVAGAFRGFGNPQVNMALESEMDKMARKLGMDPFEFRTINGLESGSVTYLGQVVRDSVGLKETLEGAKKALKELTPRIEPSKSKGKIGIGVASGFKGVGFPIALCDSAGAIIEVDSSGRVLLKIAIVDLGQGSETAMAQLAAEALGLSPDKIDVQQIDTNLFAQAGPTVSQRGTYVGGNATLGAARQLREKLISTAADQFGRDKSTIDFNGTSFVDLKAEEELITLEALAAAASDRGEVLRAEYRFEETKDEKPAFPVRFNRSTKSPVDFYYSTYSHATQVAVVEVDEQSGHVWVKHIIAAHDVGKAINPQIIDGQIAGSCLMGMGIALTEAYQVEDGWNLTDTLAKCGLTRIQRAPDISVIVVENDEPAGPFGAKGVSEMAIVPIAAAISNAIYDAIGVRIYELPATHQRVRQAIGE